jgi:hypothetical protein
VRFACEIPELLKLNANLVPTTLVKVRKPTFVTQCPTQDWNRSKAVPMIFDWSLAGGVVSGHVGMLLV